VASPIRFAVGAELGSLNETTEMAYGNMQHLLR
jgi:hypothetical protein